MLATLMIAPGLVDTRFAAAIVRNQDLVDLEAKRTPMARYAQPDEIAGAALFLASDLGAFVTGTTIHCDGGTYAAGGWYPTERGNRGWTNRPLNP